MVQSDSYYKSRAVGVTSEIGLTTDRRPSRGVSLLLFLLPRDWETWRLLYFRDTGSHVVRAIIQKKKKMKTRILNHFYPTFQNFIHSQKSLWTNLRILGIGRCRLFFKRRFSYLQTYIVNKRIDIFQLKIFFVLIKVMLIRHKHIAAYRLESIVFTILAN